MRTDLWGHIFADSAPIVVGPIDTVGLYIVTLLRMFVHENSYCLANVDRMLRKQQLSDCHPILQNQQLLSPTTNVIINYLNIQDRIQINLLATS